MLTFDYQAAQQPSFVTLAQAGTQNGGDVCFQRRLDSRFRGNDGKCQHCLIIMATSSHRVWSDHPVSPGNILKEEIEYRGMSQNDLASLMGRPPEIINDIILGKEEITQTTATEIQEALGISAQFWLNLEATYQVTLAKQEVLVSSTVPIQEDSA